MDNSSTPISIDPYDTSTNPVSIDTGQYGDPAPSSYVADNRATKTQYGLGDVLNMDKPTLYGMYVQGQEDRIRKMAANAIDAKNQSKQLQNVIDTASKGQALTMEGIAAASAPPTDPKSVVEDQYSQKYMDNIFQADANIGGDDLTNVMSQVPEVLKNDLDRGISHMSNHEYAVHKQEDLQDLYSNQGIIPWLADQAKSMVPFYDDVKLRGWMENVGAFDGFTVGNNLYEQTRSLLLLPGPEFRQKLDDITNRLAADNPSLAMRYINAVLGLSHGQILEENLNNILVDTSIPGVNLGLKKLVGSVNAVRTGLRDGIRASATIHPNPAAAAEGFGDTATAAVTKASENVVAEMQGAKPATAGAVVSTANDPIQRAKEVLPRGLMSDVQNVKDNPGPLNRELHARLVENMERYDIIPAIMETAKTLRIPLEEAAPIVMNKLKDVIRDQYPGLRNAIAQVDDPIFHPAGFYYFPTRITHFNAEQFSSAESAAKFARDNGIQEYDVVGKGMSKYYVPEAAIQRPWETKPSLSNMLYRDGELRVFVDNDIQPKTAAEVAKMTPEQKAAHFQQTEVPISTKPQIRHYPVESTPVFNEDGTLHHVDLKIHPLIQTDEDVAKAVIEQKGLGYHLLTWMPLNEDQYILKDMWKALESTKSVASDQGIRGWVNSIFGYLKSSDNTLSPFETAQRKVATGGINNYHKVLQDEMKYVEDVARGRIRFDEVTGQPVNSVWANLRAAPTWASRTNKQIVQEFKRALDMARSEIDPVTKRQGYFRKNPSELNELYQTNFHRSPTFREVQGYMAFRKNYENDRILRSVREYVNRARLGAQQHQVEYIDANGKRFTSAWFDGVIHRDLPGGDDGVLLLHDGNNAVRLTSKLGSKWREYNEAVKQGKYVVIEPYNPELKPFSEIPGVGNKHIRYVMANKSLNKPLSWEQVNRLGGGHLEYNFKHSIKEAIVEKSVYGTTEINNYFGDSTFMLVQNRAAGRSIIKVLNGVKNLLKKNDVEGAKKLFEEGLPGKSGPAMEWKDWYARTKWKEGRAGRINIHEPYYVVPKDGSILGLDSSLPERYTYFKVRRGITPSTPTSTFRDKTKGGSLARQYQIQYTQERDSEALKWLRVSGTKNNPIYNHEPAELLDPITTMNRALNQISAQSFMDDMKIAGVEGWLREAEPFLKVPEGSGFTDIRENPWWYFNNASNEKAFRPDVDKQQIWNFLSNRFKTRQFIGIPSRYDIFMHETAERIADWSFDKFGPKGQLVPTWLMDHTTSPIQLLRGLAYHTKMGLFAIPQLLVQMQTYATIAAVAPRSAVAGSAAAWLHQLSKWSQNPEFLSKLDDWATHMAIPGFHSFKPGDFTQAMKELNNRGFAHRGKEYSPLDTQLRTSFTKTQLQDFLDLGTMFFRGADQHVNYGAWYTSTLEHSNTFNKPIRSFNRKDWDTVHARSDDMAGNMTRASASIMQSGPLSTFNQFLTYQTHMGEFFFSKRIGGAGASETERYLARARMLAVYSAMFGIPSAIGITGFPAAESIKKYAYNNGYNVGEKWLTSTLMEGLPAIFMAWATGGGNYQAGNWYNIGDRMGAGGMTQFNEALNSDTPWWQFVGGASTSILANTLANGYGLYADFTARHDKFPMKWNDWADVAKEAVGFNQAWRVYNAVRTGKWLSKNEQYLADVSKMNAIFMGVSGLDLQEKQDNWTIGLAHKDDVAREKWATQNFITQYRRAIQAAVDNDRMSYKQYMTKAYAYLEWADVNEDKYPAIMALASKGWESRIDSIREQFFLGKDVPQSQIRPREKQWEQFIKLQNMRKPNG